jgi:23S rRNA (cytosine1962-C5)-methyltransferase
VAQENAKLNNVPAPGRSLEFIHQDVFDFLRSRIEQRAYADVVILDPAKLAGVKDEIPRAMRTYGDFNKLAVQIVKPGGVLVTCSCSGLVSDEAFRGIVVRAAHENNRTLQIFDFCGAGPDHPVMSDFPEGRYLKVIFARVFNRGA